MNDIYLKKIRKYELIQILSNLEISPKESKILDIGCGSGKQIQILNSFGFQTFGIDIVKHKKLNTQMIHNLVNFFALIIKSEFITFSPLENEPIIYKLFLNFLFPNLSAYHPFSQ